MTVQTVTYRIVSVSGKAWMTYLDIRVTIHPGDHSLVKVVKVEVSDAFRSQMIHLSRTQLKHFSHPYQTQLFLKHFTSLHSCSNFHFTSYSFWAGADGYNVPDFVCDIYFEGKKPCFGGVQALDGKTGAPIWTLWATHEVFALTCQVHGEWISFLYRLLI